MAKEKFMRELDELEHETKPEVKVAAPEKVLEVLISFGQWFSASGRKSKDQWDRLFIGY
jgi:hypothetical protein